MGERKSKCTHQIESQKHFDVNSLYQREGESPEVGRTPHAPRVCDESKQFANSPEQSDGENFASENDY